MSTQKAFASTGDITEKKISFTEVGPDLFAFTAEGDPNTGVIVGDDCCAVFDAQATPAMARQGHREGANCNRQADQIRDPVALSCGPRLGASGFNAQGIIASEETYRLIAERGKQDWESEFGRFPRLFRDAQSIPGLTWPTHAFQRRDDAVPWQARSEAHAARCGSYLRGHRGVGPGRARHVLGRSHRVSLRLLLRRRAFARLARHPERNP